METEVLRTAALLLATAMPATRQAAAPPSIPAVVYAAGADRSGEPELRRALTALARRFPALFDGGVVRRIDVVPDPAKPEPGRMPECGLDERGEGLLRLEEGCIGFGKGLASSGVYRAGTGMEGLLLHEGLHAWHQARVDLGEELHFEYDAATGGRVLAVLDGVSAFKQTGEWEGRDAEYLAAREAKRLELVRAHKLPQRSPDDVHAADHPGELFAYAGEFFFYSPAPGRWLSAEEEKFWTAFGEHLAGRGPMPPLPKTP